MKHLLALLALLALTLAPAVAEEADTDRENIYIGISLDASGAAGATVDSTLDSALSIEVMYTLDSGFTLGAARGLDGGDGVDLRAGYEFEAAEGWGVIPFVSLPAGGNSVDGDDPPADAGAGLSYGLGVRRGRLGFTLRRVETGDQARYLAGIGLRF